MPPRDVALTLWEASEIDDRVRAGTATAEERALNEQCQARSQANPGCQKLQKQMVKYMTDPEVESRGHQRRRSYHCRSGGATRIGRRAVAQVLAPERSVSLTVAASVRARTTGSRVRRAAARLDDQTTTLNM